MFGVNNLAESFSQIDPLSGQPLDARPSPFVDWYVDPFSNQLVLVDPLIVVPEPDAWILLLAGLTLVAFAAALRWHRIRKGVPLSSSGWRAVAHVLLAKRVDG